MGILSTRVCIYTLLYTVGGGTDCATECRGKTIRLSHSRTVPGTLAAGELRERKKSICTDMRADAGRPILLVNALLRRSLCLSNPTIPTADRLKRPTGLDGRKVYEANKKNTKSISITLNAFTRHRQNGDAADARETNQHAHTQKTLTGGRPHRRRGRRPSDVR